MLRVLLSIYSQINYLSHEYRDRIYIRKDILLKLTEYGQLNQTSLLSYCGLNLVKHKDIVNDMEQKGQQKDRRTMGQQKDNQVWCHREG